MKERVTTRALRQMNACCAPSADAGVLDHPVAWTGLAGRVVRTAVPTAWVIDLGGEPGAGLSSGAT